MVQPSGRWRMVGVWHAGGSSTPRLFSSPVSIMTKGESQSPTTCLCLHEESATIVLCSGEVSSLLDVCSGWSGS